MVFKKTVSSETDVVGGATEILQSVPVVVVLDDILYSSVSVLISFLWGVFVRRVFGKGVFVQRVFVRGFMSGGFLSGGFCPDTS